MEVANDVISSSPALRAFRHGPSTTDSAVFIQAELTRLLYSQAPMGFLATLVNIAIFTAALWSVSPSPTLLLWFVIMILITGARIALVIQHQRLAPTETEEGFWRTLYVLGAAVMGIAWGSVSIFLFPTDPSHQVFVTFVLAGMSAGAVTILSSVPLAVVSYFLPILLPLSIHFFRHGEDLGTAMGSMTLVFLCTLLFAVRRFHTVTVETLGLRFSQLGLLNRLTTQTAELHLAHEELEERVQERTMQLQAVNQQLMAEIAERRRAEEFRRQSEERFRTLIEDGSDLIALLQADGVVLYASPSHERLLGYAPGELVGKNAFSLVHPDDLPLVWETFSAGVQHQGAIDSVELRFRHNDGSWRTLESIGKNLIADPVIGGVIVNSRDITERKEAEETVKKNEERFRALIENSADIVMILDTNCAICYRSPTATGRGVHGYHVDELIGKSALEFIHPEDQQMLWEVFLKSLEQPGVAPLPNFRARHVDGSWRAMEGTLNNQLDHPTIRGIVYTGRDITERRQMEEEKHALQVQLAQAQKLQSLGTLAGGIAHDFNNLLTPIIGFSELLKKAVVPGTVAQRNLEEVLKASHRAKDLVQQLLVFSRPSSQARSLVTLHAVVEDCCHLLQASLPSTIDLRFFPDSALGVVLGDPTQLHQIVMNLCVNAWHAMEDGREGVLELAVEDAEIEEAFAAFHPPLTPGPHLKLVVRDTGSGISPELLSSIFDPFFTTKPVGKGFGLGLSIVHEIVKDHGGAILVHSTPGAGSTFEVYLPKVEETAVAAKTPAVG